MLSKFQISTPNENFYDITSKVREAIAKSGIADGIAVVSSETIIVSGGKPILGTWQGIYFCEFDPPRERTFFVKVIEG